MGARLRPGRVRQAAHQPAQALPFCSADDLDQNRTLRQVADYTTDRVTEVRADRAVARAERFLEAISPRGGKAT